MRVVVCGGTSSLSRRAMSWLVYVEKGQEMKDFCFYFGGLFLILRLIRLAVFLFYFCFSIYDL